MRPNEIFTLPVDHNLSLENLIKEGRYSYVHPDISEENFPSHARGSGIQEVKSQLFYFDRQLDSKEAVKRVREAQFCPATLYELLVVGKSNPSLQTQFRIAALGSQLARSDNSRDCYIPVLFRDEVGRYLDLFYMNRFWNGACLFLAVK